MMPNITTDDYSQQMDTPLDIVHPLTLHINIFFSASAASQTLTVGLSVIKPSPPDFYTGEARVCIC